LFFIFFIPGLWPGYDTVFAGKCAIYLTTWLIWFVPYGKLDGTLGAMVLLALPLVGLSVFAGYGQLLLAFFRF